METPPTSRQPGVRSEHLGILHLQVDSRGQKLLLGSAAEGLAPGDGPVEAEGARHGSRTEGRRPEVHEEGE